MLLLCPVNTNRNTHNKDYSNRGDKYLQKIAHTLNMRLNVCDGVESMEKVNIVKYYPSDHPRHRV